MRSRRARGASSFYGLHGVCLSIEGDDHEVRAAVQARLQRLAVADRPPGDIRIACRRFETGTPPPVAELLTSARARPVYDVPFGDVLYSESRDQLSIRFGDDVRALCELGDGRARIAARSGHRDAVWFASHPIFSLCLMELMKRHGRFALHAAALSLEGRGLLVAGTSGAGKSTLTLALVRAGFGFMGDDTCFITRGADGVRILGFPDQIGVADDTIGFFPELHFLWSRAKPVGASKRQMDVQEAYGAAVIGECEPSAIVFPRITSGATSRLESMSADDALLELVPNVLLTHRARTQAHLDALADLIRQSSCYRLWAGRDFEQVPGLLADLVVAAAAGT